MPKIPCDVVVTVIQLHLKVDFKVRTIGLVFRDVGDIDVVDEDGAGEVDGAGAHIVSIGGHIAETIDVSHKAAVALQGVGGVGNVEPCIGVAGIARQRSERTADAGPVQRHRTDIVCGGHHIDILLQRTGSGIIVGSKSYLLDILLNRRNIDH